MTLEIEPAAMKRSGVCRCCGKSRRTVWGFVYRDGGPHACYFVEWTFGKRDCEARLDVVLGRWSDDTTEDDRDAVSLAYRLVDAKPSFALADAEGRPAAEIGRAKKSADVAGTELGAEAVLIATAILEADERVHELAG